MFVCVCVCGGGGGGVEPIVYLLGVSLLIQPEYVLTACMLIVHITGPGMVYYILSCA